MALKEGHSIAFLFPAFSGHLNPSLPVARHLVSKCHKVHYLSREQMRAAIEDTGATYHSEVELCPEMYKGRKCSTMGAIEDLQEELGVKGSLVVAVFKLREVMIELMLPGVLRWLREIQAEAVVYCPLVNYEAPYAAKILKLPCVALMTSAGPASCTNFLRELIRQEGLTSEGVVEFMGEFQPRVAAIQRIRDTYGVDVDQTPAIRQLGWCETMCICRTTLVTTTEALQDPMEPELREAYQASGASFEYVGPLLDKPGAVRAGGHRIQEHEASTAAVSDEEVLATLRAARAAGRQVILVSMGTVITGDSPDIGWHGKLRGPDGPKGLTGCQLCRAAWGAAFDAFGHLDTVQLFVAVGAQPDPLGELTLPANALCLPVLPQVDLLKAGVDLFLTHGGQNSLMEALATGVPLVVCPGFSDQPTNAQKAVDLGVGLKVDRPFPEDGEEEAGAAKYRAETAAALQKVLQDGSFKAAADRWAEELRDAGGVARAAEVVLEAVKSGA